MQVYKFGGTSLGSANLLKTVADIIDDDQEKIVVLSANGKTTDDFAKIAELLSARQYDEAVSIKSNLSIFYLNLIDELFSTNICAIKAREFVHTVFHQIQSRFENDFTIWDSKWLVSRGEIISTGIFSILLSEKNIHHQFMWASEIMYKDKSGQADLNRIKNNLDIFIEKNRNTKLILTQGFICCNHIGIPDTFGRGGSDYTASLLGQTSEASVIQIWSDVDGFLNNDPGFVRGSLPLENMSFDEAAELAYFGARVLHPLSIIPAKKAAIPVLLKNTLNPKAKGTIISEKGQEAGIKAIAARDNICSITIHSGRMLLAYGFLRQIFEVFEKFKTSVDMVTTSEVSVSVTIDYLENLEDILAELQTLGEVSFTQNQSIVCVVGDYLSENRGIVKHVFESLKDIPLRMISYGAGKNSLGFLVDTKDKVKTLEALNLILASNQITNDQSCLISNN